MKITRYIAALATGVVLLASCDYVDSPYIVQGPNGCTAPEPDFTPRTNPVRKVLIEDFTGHRCGNCPRAAETIHDIQINPSYTGKVVAIGLHSVLPSEYTGTYPSDTTLNPQQKYVYDFTTEEGTAIDQKFEISNTGLPRGMVNRRKVSGSFAVSYTAWESQVGSILSAPPDLDIQIKNFYDPADSSLCSYAYVEGLNNISGNYKLCLFLTENGFVNWQKDYTASPQDISGYEHNHILRAAFNGAMGTSLVNGAITDGQTFVNGYSIKFDPSRWNVNNCYVVAFVYDENTWEVIQAEEQKVN